MNGQAFTSRPSNDRPLEALQERFGEALDQEIESWLSSRGINNFYGMMRYQLGYVDAHMRPSRQSGKRFRPLLCLFACEIHGGDWRKALPAAAGVELLHNFSLIHDDIEDRDPVRRHRSTVWKVWGERQAINAGDAMFALASKAVLATAIDEGRHTELAQEFEEMALRLTEGQYLDMSFETNDEVTIHHYIPMITLKSAAIIAFSLWAGALIADASDEKRAAMRDFGQELGRAFQVNDDIQGIWASAERTGKERAKDLQNRKKTLPILLALEEEGARPELDRFMRGQSDDLNAALSQLTASRAKVTARQQVEKYLQQAAKALDAAHTPASAAAQFQALAREIADQ